MKAQYFNTYCIGFKIQGTAGDVTITKKNKKSFHFEGAVHCYNNGNHVAVKGVATFWKQYQEGGKTIDAYKSGSAVLKILS